MSNILNLAFEIVKATFSQSYQLSIQVFQGKKMNSHKIFKYIYEGTIEAEEPCYVKRKADDELYKKLKNGQLCYIFNSRKMGKSSLECGVRKRLIKDDGFICVSIDLSFKGTDKDSVTINKWYFSIIKTLAKELNLDIYANGKPDALNKWWKERRNLTYPEKLKDLLDKIIKDVSKENILIVFDEIDSVISLKFPTNDFFAFIRACYNHRANNPEYKRLNFCLVGTATPSDLISDNARTPFNIGEAIELTGFTFEEAKKGLSEGLRDKVNNPEQVLQEILVWTDGQPFLTQKLCDLLIQGGNKNPNIQELVQTKVITNWDNSDVDTPEYLRTIRNRILFKDEYIEKRLILYKEIWQSDNKIKPDRSREQEQLCLSGLVINSGGKLRISNLICRTIFDGEWVQKEINELPPSYLQEYASNWVASNDDFLLLKGQVLQDALNWEQRVGAKFTDLFPEYRRFIEASKNAELEAKFAQKNNINYIQKENLLTIRDKLFGKINIAGTQQIEIAKQVSVWTNDSELILDKMICQSLSSNSFISEGDEIEWVDLWVQKNIINNWNEESNPLKQKLEEIQKCLLDSQDYFGRLETYQKILQGENVDAIDENDRNALLVSGLIVKSQEKLRVKNKIYESIFNLQWIKYHLPPYANLYNSWRDSTRLNGESGESSLLQGQDLENTLIWIQNQPLLNELEIEFIITSLVWETWRCATNQEIQKAQTEAVKIVILFRPQLQEKTNTPDLLIGEILRRTGIQPCLLKEVLRLVCACEVIPIENQVKWLEQLVRSYIKDWKAPKLAENLDYNHPSNYFWLKLQEEYQNPFLLVDEFLDRQALPNLW